MKKKFLVGILISSFLVLGSGIADSTPIVDQEYDPTGEANTWSGIGGADQAQVFTVGLSGLLTGVDVLIRRQDNQGKDEDDLIVDIRNTVGGIPINDDLNTLALVQITALDVPTTYDFYYVDLSAFNMQITAGDMLAVVLRTANPLLLDTCYSWEGNANNNSYEGGGHYYRNSNYGWTSFSNGTYDYGFRTYVETLNPVSEPPTANAGPDRKAYNQITLDGSQSYDADGDIVSYQWVLCCRGNSVFDRTATGVTPTFLNLQPGFYDVILTVTDDCGLTASSECVVFCGVGKRRCER